MKTVIGIEVVLPQGQSLDEHTQIMQEIQQQNTIIDYSRHVLFVATSSEAANITLILAPHVTESISNVWLPLKEEWEESRLFIDYGVKTSTGARYLELAIAPIWTFEAIDITSEPGLAWLQAEEYIIAQLQTDGQRFAAFDRQFEQLLDKTASIYGCRLRLTEIESIPC